MENNDYFIEQKLEYIWVAIDKEDKPIGYNFYIKYGFKEIYDFEDNVVALAYKL